MNMADDWGIFLQTDAEQTEEDRRIDFEEDLRRVLAGAAVGAAPNPTEER